MISRYATAEATQPRREPVVALIVIVALLAAFIILGIASCTTVSAGNVGVLTLFGRVTYEVLPEGIHLINPFKSNKEMTVRTQSREETSETPSSEGLKMSIDASILYHLDPAQAAAVYQHLGTEYEKTIIVPNFRSAIRDATANHKASSMYSAERQEVENEITKAVRTQLEPRGIILERVLLRDVRLPPSLATAIEAKQQADQESQAMAFRLTKEQQEAERKRIEAQGIHDFQEIVSRGISAPLLQWKGIEATQELARSPNTKIVVIGNTKNGLPLIMSE